MGPRVATSSLGKDWLTKTYLENLKFDFDEVFPQFNMAVSSIYKKQGREAVRF